MSNLAKSIIKRAAELSKLSPAQRAVAANKPELSKLASWVIKNPSLARQLKNAVTEKVAMQKKASAKEPLFTLPQALHIIGGVAESLCKRAAEAAAEEDKEARKLARVMKKASELSSK